MSMFYCAHCDNLSDSHDGAEDIKGELWCVYCVAELEDEVDFDEPLDVDERNEP